MPRHRQVVGVERAQPLPRHGRVAGPNHVGQKGRQRFVQVWRDPGEVLMHPVQQRRRAGGGRRLAANIELSPQRYRGVGLTEPSRSAPEPVLAPQPAVAQRHRHRSADGRQLGAQLRLALEPVAAVRPHAHLGDDRVRREPHHDVVGVLEDLGADVAVSGHGAGGDRRVDRQAELVVGVHRHHRGPVRARAR